jgi:DNA-binding NtrC family response regulator
MPDSVLLIDRDADALRAIGSQFESAGYDVARELSADEGLTTYDRLRPEAVLIELDSTDGVDVIRRLRERGAAVIALTAGEDPALAARALALGAEGALSRSVEAALLLGVTARVVEKVKTSRLASVLANELLPREGLEALGQSAPMRELARQIAVFAQSDRTTVLIQGEPGTGKAWVAAQIHRASPRRQGAFLRVRCTGRSVAALDALLFGHERGALPEATHRELGLFEIAAGGTILLEEVGELPFELQPKLLKVLETRTFRRLGGSHDIRADVRVIATTCRDLGTEVESGRFREELQYRLDVMPIRLPALKDRSGEDRLALVLRLLAELQLEVPGGPASLAPECLERLLGYSWPGNIREVRNVLERALILARGQAVVGVEQLPGEFRNRPGIGDRRHTPLTIDELERQHIERTLRHHGGNRTRSAQELGISRATLINKIKRYAITL